MPRSKREQQDPTRQAANRAQGFKRLSNRLLSAKRQILTRFRAVPVSRSRETVVVNETRTVYSYDLTAEQQAQLLREIQATVNQELETEGDEPAPNWFWRDDIEPPYRQGTAEETVQFNQLIALALVLKLPTSNGMQPQRIPVELAITTPGYFDGLRRQIGASFVSIKGLSDTTSTQVGRAVSNGMAAGLSPTEIAGQITERFNVAESSAKRIADTEVNTAYNNARMRASVEAAEQSGLSAGVVHVSALLPTTRQHHADRHGNAYTVADQLAWWDEGANRINCHCSTRSVLIDSEGRVVNTELQDELKAER